VKSVAESRENLQGSGPRPRVYVIAEAGVNHDGSVDVALRLVDIAHSAGADAVKFQSFRAGDLVGAGVPRAEYQTRNINDAATQLEMLQRLELSFDAQRDIAAHARRIGIEFISTPFDFRSLRFLVEDVGVSRVKISSGDLTNAPLLLAAARMGTDVILSSGMATLDETLDALGVLAFGYLEEAAAAPSREAFRAAWQSPHSRATLRERVTVLHCTSEYPTPLDDVNLRAMDALANATGLRVGLSDHSEGVIVAIAAAARGAAVIEKHFTLDRGRPGPDHRASLEPPELAQLVAGIRDVERALGTGTKEPVKAELATKLVSRRSLVAGRPIHVGEVFSEMNLAIKRPGIGISPTKYWEYLGRVATRDYAQDELIDP
jgi:N-acetylneuraminate synthase